MKMGSLHYGVLGVQLAIFAALGGQVWGQENTSAEIFRISQVGSSKDPEARTKLKEFFDKITADYNAKAEADFAAAQKSFEGDRLKILKKLQKKDANGQLYMVAYQGEKTVISLDDSGLRKGLMTPPLELERDGTIETMVTRTELRKKGGNGKGKGKGKAAKPAEEVTFFGVPIAGPDEEIVEVQVKEMVPKYRATVSTTEMATPEKMGKELFLSTLKNGETFTIVRDEKRRCMECNGFGRVSWNGIGAKPADGKMACPDCSGGGKVDWKVTYTVGW